MQDTNTQSSWGMRYPGVTVFQQTAVQDLIKPLGQELHSQISVEPWHETKFLLTGRSGGKDEHTTRVLVEAHPQPSGTAMHAVPGDKSHWGPH